MMLTPHSRKRSVLGAVVALLLACAPEKPPAPDKSAMKPDAAGAAAAAGATWNPEQGPAALTYAGERGEFKDASNVGDVPEGARGMVRVVPVKGPRAPAGMVWVANLSDPQPQGEFGLEAVPRELFEELCLGQGRSSVVELPEGIEPPEVVPASDKIIVYKTDWCGVCKKLLAYLDRKGVAYEAKDVEKDRSAAAELQGKAKQAGIKTGSVPVIDVRGELMVGFNRKRLESLL